MNGWLARLRRRWFMTLHRPPVDYYQVELLESRQLLSGFPILGNPLLPAPSLPEALQRSLPQTVIPTIPLPGLALARAAVGSQTSALPVLPWLGSAPPIAAQATVAVPPSAPQDLQLGAALDIALGGSGTVRLQAQVGVRGAGQAILAVAGGLDANLGAAQGPRVEATVVVPVLGSPSLRLDSSVPTTGNLDSAQNLSGDVSANVELSGGPDLGFHGSVAAGTKGGSAPGSSQDGTISNTRSVVLMPANTMAPVCRLLVDGPGSAGPNLADHRNLGGREEQESGVAADIAIADLAPPSITSSGGTVDAIFRSAGVGESDAEILDLLALSPETPFHPPEVIAPQGPEDQAAAVPSDQPPSRGIGAEDWAIIEIPGDNPEGEGNLASPALGRLADYTAFDLAALERALQQFLAQMGQLDRELAQRGFYPWLVCLAAAAVVYELTRHRAKKPVKGRTLTTPAEKLAFPWRAGLAGLTPGA